MSMNSKRVTSPNSTRRSVFTPDSSRRKQGSTFADDDEPMSTADYIGLMAELEREKYQNNKLRIKYNPL